MPGSTVPRECQRLVGSKRFGSHSAESTAFDTVLEGDQEKRGLAKLKTSVTTIKHSEADAIKS